MIVGIEGKVIKKEPTFLYVRTDVGLTYKVNISLFTSSKINSDSVSLHVTQIIREDYHGMYGFLDIDEKKIFDTVIKLNGIGPSTALAICSTLSPSDFASALSSQNVEAFKRVPGIGPKSAKRILVELSDFSLESLELGSSDRNQLDTILALESLGFKKDRIRKILPTCKSTSTPELIKEALKKLT